MNISKRTVILLACAACLAYAACSSSGSGGGVIDPPVGDSTFAATVGGSELVASQPGAIDFQLEGPNGEPALRLVLPATSGESLTLTLPEEIAGRLYELGSGVSATLNLYKPDDGRLHEWVGCDGTGSIEVTSETATRVEGTFEFEAAAVGGPDACTGDRLDVRGSFSLRMSRNEPRI
ncbi:MAG: hypothetical protein GY716_04345 [bacterium]|nr:hypothetical protein [bacterium]